MRKPASNEIISDSVELCKTEVCFLHIQLIETKVWLPKTHIVPPEVDFESLKIFRKIGVLKQSQSALFCSVSHMTILFVITRVMNARDQTRLIVCPQALVHFVIDRASLFADHRISGRPIRAKYKHFRTI